MIRGMLKFYFNTIHTTCVSLFGFSVQITLAAMVNVWTGFLIGLIAARVSGLSWPDAVTVMVETGIQNTGVSIVLLGVSLPKPDGDMSAVSIYLPVRYIERKKHTSVTEHL